MQAQGSDRRLRRVAIVALVCLGGIGLKFLHDFWESQALSRLASDLGIEPTWQAYREYQAETFAIGMTRDEVWREAAKIGPYTVTPKRGMPY
ncbi:hypothetical protein ACFLWA_10480 [Chloroflexota bacterium]